MPALRRRRKPPAAGPVPAPAEQQPTAAPPPGPEYDNLPQDLEWSYNPWQISPARSALALAICLAVGYLAGWWMQAPLWALIGFMLVAGMNSVLFLPVRYRLDQRGVTVWFLGVASQRDWQHYRNAYFHPQLVHLTTMPRPSALDPFRGHSLLFNPRSPQGSREVVRAFVRARVSRPS